MVLEKIKKNNKIPYTYGITKIFDYENNKISHNTSAFLNYILFYISFFFINFHTKCLNYINNSYNDKINFNSTSRYENDLEPLKSDNEKENFIFKEINPNEYKNISLNGTFRPNKEQIKMQSLFNFDMDCWLVLFLKNSKNENYFRKIKLFLISFCYSTGFSLHACRLSLIFWIIEK